MIVMSVGESEESMSYGWWVIVEDEYMKNPERKIEDYLLAKWKIKPGRIDWLKAVHFRSRICFRQTRFKAIAHDVLPLLDNGPPGSAGYDVLPQAPDEPIEGNWISEVTIHHDRIASCPPDRKLWVDIMDISEDDLLDLIDEAMEQFPDSDEEQDNYICGKAASTSVSISLSYEDDPETGRLAEWETCNIEWLESLKQEGKAHRSDVKHPFTYKALAKDVLPIISNGPPSPPADCVIFHYDRMAVCPPDRLLSILLFYGD